MNKERSEFTDGTSNFKLHYANVNKNTNRWRSDT